MITYKLSDNKAVGTLEVSGEITAFSTGQIHTELARALSNGIQQVILDLKEAAAADVNLFQVLCAANLFAFERGKTFTLEGQVPDPLASIVKMARIGTPGSCSRCGKQPCIWAAS